MQLLHYYVGTITKTAIMEVPAYAAFAKGWYVLADEAEKKGTRLIVIELPKDAQLSVGVGDEPADLQLVDADLMRELCDTGTSVTQA